MKPKIQQPANPISQKLTAAKTSGTRVSFSPRKAPAATVCTPSAMKKLAPSTSSDAASATVCGSGASRPRNSSGSVSRVSATSSVIAAMKATPSAIAAKPARRVAAASPRPAA